MSKAETTAIPESYERVDPASTLENRFKAWRNLVENLESYFKHLEKTHEGTSKDYAKLAKTIDLPFKDRGVFEQAGIQDVFAGLQGNANKLSSDYATHAKSVDSTLVKATKHLSSEIKDFVKRLEKDGVKGGKTVSKNQTDTQKHIELLSTHISKGKSGSSSLKPTEDPFLTHRSVLSRLNDQVQEENAHHHTLIALQNECAQFEAKIVKSIQDLVGQMGSQAASQAQSLTNTHQQLTNSTNAISPSGEWNAFVNRDRTLANPNAAPRTAKSITFPGSDYELTQPVLEGDLLRKGTVIKKYNSAYYVLTPAGFLHEFKSKSFETDPEPSWSLDIKTCAIGAHSPPNVGKAKWTISGKTKGVLSSKHDFQFQATSYDDMLAWWTAIRKFAASSPNVEELAQDDSDSEVASPSVPTHSANVGVPQQSSLHEHPESGSHEAVPGTYAANDASSTGFTTNPAQAGTTHAAQPSVAPTAGLSDHSAVDANNAYPAGTLPGAAHGAA